MMAIGCFIFGAWCGSVLTLILKEHNGDLDDYTFCANCNKEIK